MSTSGFVIIALIITAAVFLQDWRLRRQALRRQKAVDDIMADLRKSAIWTGTVTTEITLTVNSQVNTAQKDTGPEGDKGDHA